MRPVAAVKGRTRRAPLLQVYILFISFHTSLQYEAVPELVNQVGHKFLFSPLGLQIPSLYLSKLLMSFSTPLGTTAHRPGMSNCAWSCYSTLTTQMLERAWSSAFTRKPPKSESISSPPVLANSTFGSRPTAATIWSVSTWGEKKRNNTANYHSFHICLMDIVTVHDVTKN